MKTMEVYTLRMVLGNDWCFCTSVLYTLLLQFFMVVEIIQTVLVDLELKQEVRRSKLAILILKMMISFSNFF